MNIAYRKHSSPGYLEVKKMVEKPSVRGISIATNEGLELVPFEKIVHITSSSNYSIIWLSDGKKLVVSRTLKSINEVLPDQIFIRVHQSHIVRWESIVRLTKESLELTDGKMIPYSKKYKNTLMEKINHFYSRP